MKTGLISKLIKIIIVVILPLAAGFAVGNYAYSYYQDFYFDHYMDKASDDNTEDRLISYLKYINQSVEYSQENGEYSFYLKQDIKTENGEDICTFAIIRANEVIYEEYENKIGTVIGKRNNYYMTYYFAIYNVNYENAVKALDPTGEYKLKYTELPGFSIEIKDQEDSDKVYEFDLTTVAQVTGESNLTIIYDYGYSPEKDSDGKKLNAGNPTSMRYYVLNAKNISSTKFSEKVEINVYVNYNLSDDETEPDPEKVATIEKNDFYSNEHFINNTTLQKEIDNSFTKTYNEDIFAAGYTKFVFGKYIWWEALIAIIAVGIICSSFVLVWNAEEEKNTKKQK